MVGGAIQDFCVLAVMHVINLKEEKTVEEIKMIYLNEDDAPTPRAGYGCGYACQAGFFCPGGFICN